MSSTGSSCRFAGRRARGFHAVRDPGWERQGPGNLLVTREVDLRGAFRFDRELDDALGLLADGLDVAPVVTHTVPADEARAAFDLAGDRSVASKVLLDFTV